MLVQIDKLQRIVSQAGTAPSFLRDYFFGTPAYYPNGEINIEIEKNGQQVAPFVAPEIGGKVMERMGSTMKTFTAPEVAPQRVITTKNLLAAAGNDQVQFIEAGSTPETRKAALIKKDFTEIEDAITRREELMCGEALFRGQVTVTGDGYGTQVIQFWDQADRPYSELAGGALWSTATADPIADFEFGISQTQNRSGITASDVIMSPKTWQLARKNDGLLKQLDTNNLDVGEILGQNVANAMGVRLVARLAGANIWTYSKTLKVQQEDGSIVDTPVVPDGLVLFGSKAVPTEMAYGVVTVIDPTKSDGLYPRTGRRVVNQYLSTKNPAGIVNETKCAPLPIPKVPDGFYVLKVTA